MIKRLLLILMLIQIPSFILSESDTTNYTIVSNLGPIPAKEARELIFSQIYVKHEEAIDWWMHEINSKIVAESKHGSANTLVDITVASGDVQDYLLNIYEQEGYKTELIPGWTGENGMLHRGGHPDGKTYLGLSW